jgi:hypothetical protein
VFKFDAKYWLGLYFFCPGPWAGWGQNFMNGKN